MKLPRLTKSKRCHVSNFYLFCKLAYSNFCSLSCFAQFLHFVEYSMKTEDTFLTAVFKINFQYRSIENGWKEPAFFLNFGPNLFQRFMCLFRCLTSSGLACAYRSRSQSYKNWVLKIPWCCIILIWIITI